MKDSKFYSLGSDKRERIINAAMAEFIRNGYDKASTNEMVKEAQISKGSLFNYFKNKRDLYFFLFEYAIEVTNQIFERMDMTETDIFTRYRKISLIKLEIMRRYPEVFNFLWAVADEESSEVKPEIASTIRKYAESSYEKLYQNIDLTKFRDDIDIQKTINIINWTLQSFAENERAKLKIKSVEEINMAEAIKELDSYLEIMKKCFYK